MRCFFDIVSLSKIVMAIIATPSKNCMYVIMLGTIGGVLKYVKRKGEKGREREIERYTLRWDRDCIFCDTGMMTKSVPVDRRQMVQEI